MPCFSLSLRLVKAGVGCFLLNTTNSNRNSYRSRDYAKGFENSRRRRGLRKRRSFGSSETYWLSRNRLGETRQNQLRRQRRRDYEKWDESNVKKKDRKIYEKQNAKTITMIVESALTRTGMRIRSGDWVAEDT